MTHLCCLFLTVVILLACGTQWALGGKENNYKSALKHKLDATIYKLEFRNGTESIDNLPRESKQVCREVASNPSPVTVKNTIRKTATVFEILVFQVPAPFTQMDGAEGECGLQFEYESGVRGVSLPDVREKLRSQYQWSKIDSSTTKNITIVSQGREFEGEQEIVIPPCSTCVFLCMEQRVRDFPLDYTAYAKVSVAKDTLAAEEIKNNLPEGMKYIRDVDQHTVEVSVEGSMYVGFELGGLADVTCHRDPSFNCPTANHLLLAANHHQTYNTPIRVIESNSSPRPTILSFLKNTYGLVMANFS